MTIPGNGLIRDFVNLPHGISENDAASNARSDGHGRVGIVDRYRSRCVSAVRAKKAAYRLSRYLLGGDQVACRLDHHQAAGRLLVGGGSHAFARGRCVRLYPPV